MRAQGPGQSALLLLDVIDILQTLHIPYAIVGAFAASFHGVIRASLDADAVMSVRSGQTGVEALLKALRATGCQVTHRVGDADDPIGAVVTVEDQAHNRVDLLMKIHGMSEDVFARTVETEFMQARIRVIGVEDFIAMKLFAGSPQDIEDAIGVLKVSYERIRLPLLNELVQPYGQDALERLRTLLRLQTPR